MNTAQVYALLGLVLTSGGAAFAVTRERAGRSFYAAEVYHLTPRTHRRFAAISLAAAAGFVAALRWPALETPLLAVYTLLLVLYGSSFARGFSDDDE